LESNGALPVAGTIDDRFKGMFPYRNFNRMQSIAVPIILKSDENAVISAPTASGKTVLAEAAMARELGKPAHGKVLFIAPLRALTNEKESEWKRVLSGIGLKVYVVTGERELYPSEAMAADVVITTPEKWDSATRKYMQERYAFVRDVALVVVDEVHLLDSDSRGGTLEAVISRMRRISSIFDKKLRIVALSGTMPNIGDVARWIGAPPENVLEFDGSYRPIELETDVLPYYPKANDFFNKYVRIYRAFDLIKNELGDGHQALMFVSTRQDTQQAADKLCEIVRKSYPYMLQPPEAIRLQELKNKATNSKLKGCLPCGIAFHHAGLSAEDKALIEGGFKEGVIRILVSTSTLAWGVNLPARVVVVRDIEIYDPIQGNKDISAIDLLQMLGRAGRPGYDTMGKGYVIVPHERVGEYKALLKDGKAIESMLKHSLEEHLNAEISGGMVKSARDAAEWLKTTFYYVRSQGQRSPLDVEALSVSKIKYLVRNGFVKEDGGVLSSMPLGTITSDYYLKLETALLFKEYALKGVLCTDDVLDIVAKAAEFSDVVARPGEASSLRAYSGEPGGMAKVRAILAGLIGRTLPDELKSDAWAIKQNASRLLGAFSRFCEEYSGPTLSRKVRMVSLQLDKGIPEEAIELASIDGVGERSLELLMKGGIRSLRDAADKKPEDLIKMGIRGAVAIDIVDAAHRLPSAEVDLSGIPGTLRPGVVSTSVTVRNVGAGGKFAVSVKANGSEVISERFYLGNGNARSLPLELDFTADTTLLVVVEYIDTMLPAEELSATIKVQRDPSGEKTAENVQREVMKLTPGKYFVIAGEAGVKYEGRAHDSYEGSIVLLIKPDSTVVVHADRGVYPRNYMSRAQVSQTNGAKGMKILAESNGEKLSVTFKNVELFQAPFEQMPVNKRAIEAPENIIVKPPQPELSDSDRALEKALRDARSMKAREMRVPPYTIFQDKTIYDLVAKKPKTREELMGIYGIGQAKAEKYGDLILKILSGEQ
jgi:replicative superfamily II helicase